MHPRFLIAFFLAAFALTSLAGCGESLAISADPTSTSKANPLGEDNDSNLIRLDEGDLLVVKAQIFHEEIEGSSSFDVEDLRADDATIVEISPIGDAKFIVRAIAPGETIIRAKIDGDERGTTPIRVGLPGALVNGVNNVNGVTPTK